MNPTKAERDDFRLFCQKATSRQLQGIYEKEKNRPVYRAIVQSVAKERDIELQ